MERVLWVAAGGAAGSVARYAVGVWLAPRPERFPWATFAVNVAGSFLLGAVMHLAGEARVLSETARVAIGVGVLGGFTTYSAFAYETWRLGAAGAWGEAALYAFATLGACLAAVAAGAALARAVAP